MLDLSEWLHDLSTLGIFNSEPTPLSGQTSWDVVSGSFVGGCWWAKLGSDQDDQREQCGFDLPFFRWIGWWPTWSLGLGATLTSYSLSFLFGNMSRTVSLTPWSYLALGRITCSSKNQILRFNSSQESGGREGAAILGSPVSDLMGFVKPFQGEILRQT